MSLADVFPVDHGDPTAARAEVDKLRVHQSERWNVEPSGDGLMVCRNHHEKGEKCDYEYFVPARRAEAAEAEVAALKDDIQVQSGYIAEMEATEPAAMRRALKAEAEVAALRAHADDLDQKLTKYELADAVRYAKAEATAARLREALEYIHTIASSVLHGAATGQQAGISPWNMTVGTKREILRTIDAALAGKEADRGE